VTIRELQTRLSLLLDSGVIAPENDVVVRTSEGVSLIMGIDVPGVPLSMAKIIGKQNLAILPSQ
jgi:hypothetical protein